MVGSLDFFSRRLSAEEVFSVLERYSRSDAEPRDGRLFAYVYETGLEELRRVSHRAYSMFVDKNMLDFTVFPSIIEMEKDVVGITASLLRAEEASGVFTSGGTESNFLAVYSALNLYKSRRGLGETPELVKPVTVHPSIDKAAEYMGVKVVNADVDPETLKADPGSIQERITGKTALVVVSAPDWPFGSVDPVREVAEITSERGVWLHVDGCLGGYILPFLRMLGEEIPEYDFSVDGVYSISADLHKYGYAPKGSSLILFRSGRLKEYCIYANVRWPGYYMVNPGVLSSRSAGGLAAAWATLHFLGVEGYLELARKVLAAKRRIVDGFESLGYRKLGRAEASILSFTHENVNVFRVVDIMRRMGWHLQAQFGIQGVAPPNIHLTLMPVHMATAEDMVRDLRVATGEAGKLPPLETRKFMDALASGDVDSILKSLGIEKGRFPEEMAVINELMRTLPAETVEYMLKYVVAHLLY